MLHVFGESCKRRVFQFIDRILKSWNRDAVSSQEFIDSILTTAILINAPSFTWTVISSRLTSCGSLKPSQNIVDQLFAAQPSSHDEGHVQDRHDLVKVIVQTLGQWVLRRGRRVEAD